MFKRMVAWISAVVLLGVAVQFGYIELHIKGEQTPSFFVAEPGGSGGGGGGG